MKPREGRFGPHQVFTEEEIRERRRAQWRAFAAKKKANWTPEQRAKHGADTLARYHRRKEDPIWLTARRMREKERAARPEDKEKQRAYDKAKNATEKVRERRRELQRIRYQEKLKDDPKHRAESRARYHKHYEENASYYSAKGSESARRKKRTFGTLSSEHKKQVIALYVEAKRLTEETGIPHEVDHIEPLRGKNSCGLHVPWNLQILTKRANREKGNRFGDPHHRTASRPDAAFG